MWNYSAMAESDSMLNTPPTFGVLPAGADPRMGRPGRRRFDRHGRSGNRAKAEALYTFIDASGLLPQSGCEGFPLLDERAVPYRPTANSTRPSSSEAAAAGLTNLAGHRSVGGMRASIYNAMPAAGVQALIDFMTDFERHNG